MIRRILFFLFTFFLFAYSDNVTCPAEYPFEAPTPFKTLKQTWIINQTEIPAVLLVDNIEIIYWVKVGDSFDDGYINTWLYDKWEGYKYACLNVNPCTDPNFEYVQINGEHSICREKCPANTDRSFVSGLCVPRCVAPQILINNVCSNCESGSTYHEILGECIDDDCPIREVCALAASGPITDGGLTAGENEFLNLYDLYDCNNILRGEMYSVESVSCFDDINGTDPGGDEGGTGGAGGDEGGTGGAGGDEGGTGGTGGTGGDEGGTGGDGGDGGGGGDDNVTDPHDCGYGMYWSINAEMCLPIFSGDSNGTGIGGGGGDGDDDHNGTMGDDKNTTDPDDENKTDGEEFDGFYNKAKSLFSEIHVDDVLDIASGSMGKATWTFKGNTYTIFDPTYIPSEVWDTLQLVFKWIAIVFGLLTVFKMP